MKAIWTLVLLIFLGHLQGHAQRLEAFSENPQEFLAQLGDYLTAGKQKKMEDLYKSFQKSWQGGRFTPDETQRIHATCNAMLGLRMTANPYFYNYLRALQLVKNAENGEQRFTRWHDMLDSLLANIQNRRFKPFDAFLKFSMDFFEFNALNFRSSGTSWLVRSPGAEWLFEQGQPLIAFEKLDLIAFRRQDTILIQETSGRFFPVEGVFRGQGGKVTWERLGLGPEVFVELGPFELEVNKSLYEVPEATLHYPLFFGNRSVKGRFSDKVVSSNSATEGSYPRFESADAWLEVENLGEGIQYFGGFRLHGTTIYGFGTKNQPARLTIAEDGRLVFKGSSELFTIRREERIVAEKVNATIYLGQDSIYHPSVNIRFEIPSRRLLLSRGQRGSDRNPFFNSLHQVNIDVDEIEYRIPADSILFGKKDLGLSANLTPAVFESLKYFELSDYRRIQNISSTNPIALIKVAAEEVGYNQLDANYLAQRLNPRFSVENIKPLLYHLVSKGFINYDAEREEVQVKDKIFHYADASQEKTDYDVLRVESQAKNTNAVLNLKDSTIAITGVSSYQYSARQRVGVRPFDNLVKIKPDRNMDFSGRVFAGFTTLSGKDFHFKYRDFSIEMDSIRFFDIFVPTGVVDQRGRPEALSIGSRIENFSGVLLIDAPDNKSGRQDIPMFPSLQGKSHAFIHYDVNDTMAAAYPRDSFYFRLDPFSFNSLDQFTREDVHFKGQLFSADIFPPFPETVRLQEDESLGFETQTPQGGVPTYQGKGNYEGEISLSNRGLFGNGVLSYLGADIASRDLVFQVNRATGSAEQFDLEEGLIEGVEVPRVHGEQVTMDWRPYRDSMYITPEDKPFEMFNTGTHFLEGTLVLTPGGLKGKGVLDWEQARLGSKLLSFGRFSVRADTANLKIKSDDPDAMALESFNLQADIDFAQKRGKFQAHETYLQTVLPYNQYETSFNQFDWDMDKGRIVFHSEPGALGQFLSVHPDQDSLLFAGESASYDLESYHLQIGGVPFIVASDAFIYPADGKVEVEPGAVIQELENAKIVADTINRYHVINRAKVKILGKKEYRASGFYEYNVGPHKQEIEFSDIVGTRVGEGSRSEKASVTRATGEITPEHNFFIDHKTRFMGTISLSADKPRLHFDGFARLESDKLPAKHWFSMNCEADKNDLIIPFDSPKNYEGQPLETGLFLSKESARTYPRIMQPLFFRKDRPLLPISKGYLLYDEEKDQFILGDSAKVFTDSRVGNLLTFDNRSGKINMEGRFNIGSGLEYVSVAAAGQARTTFGEVTIDTLLGTRSMDSEVALEVLSGIKIILPEKLLQIMATDFKSSTFDARPIPFLNDLNFYKKALAELFPNTEATRKAISDLNFGSLVLPKPHNDFTFFFGKTPLKWYPDYQSFLTTRLKLPLVSIGGESINSQVDGYLEFRMPTNEDDRLYVYLKSPSGLYYFFGYKQGVLSMVSNNTRFMDELLAMKESDLIVKMPDGETYEMQPVNPGTANAFVRRIQAANQN